MISFPSVSREKLFGAAVILLVGLLFFLRFGYSFGAGDQDEILPLLYHRLDPRLFLTDWYVQVQAGAYSVRLFVVLLLQGLSLLLPVWLAVLVAYLGAWALIGSGVFTLARIITGNVYAAAGSVVLALLLTPGWTLGGNDLPASFFAPSLLGWGLALWGLIHGLRDRPVQAGLLLGLATWMQALVGLHVMLVLTGWLLWSAIVTRRRETWMTVLQLMLVFGLSALPALLPVFLQQAPSGAGSQADLFYIMIAYRHPHHYLPGSFPLSSYVKFFTLVILGAISWYLLHRHRAVQHERFLATTLGITALACLISFVFTEISPSFSVAKLQLFKLTVLAKLLFVTLIAGAVVRWLPSMLTNGLDRCLQHARALLVGVCLVWLLVGVGLLAGLDGLQRRAWPWRLADDPWHAVEVWARTETPVGAIFGIPPSNTSFRSQAQRSIVVNFKAFPFQPWAIEPWFARLRALAPHALPNRGGNGVLPVLDAAFEDLTADEVLALARTYGMTHIARQTPLPAVPGIRLVFEAAPWHVYVLDPPPITP